MLWHIKKHCHNHPLIVIIIHKKVLNCRKTPAYIQLFIQMVIQYCASILCQSFMFPPFIIKICSMLGLLVNLT